MISATARTVHQLQALERPLWCPVQQHIGKAREHGVDRGITS